MNVNRHDGLWPSCEFKEPLLCYLLQRPFVPPTREVRSGSDSTWAFLGKTSGAIHHSAEMSGNKTAIDLCGLGLVN